MNRNLNNVGSSFILAGIPIPLPPTSDNEILIYDKTNNIWTIVTISGSGIIIGATNDGAGAQIFKSISAGILHFRTITSPSNLTAVTATDTVSLDLSANLTGILSITSPSSILTINNVISVQEIQNTTSLLVVARNGFFFNEGITDHNEFSIFNSNNDYFDFKITDVSSIGSTKQLRFRTEKSSTPYTPLIIQNDATIYLNEMLSFINTAPTHFLTWHLNKLELTASADIPSPLSFSNIGSGTGIQSRTGNNVYFKSFLSNGPNLLYSVLTGDTLNIDTITTNFQVNSFRPRSGLEVEFNNLSRIVFKPLASEADPSILLQRVDTSANPISIIFQDISDSINKYSIKYDGQMNFNHLENSDAYYNFNNVTNVVTKFGGNTEYFMENIIKFRNTLYFERDTTTNSQDISLTRNGTDNLKLSLSENTLQTDFTIQNKTPVDVFACRSNSNNIYLASLDNDNTYINTRVLTTDSITGEVKYQEKLLGPKYTFSENISYSPTPNSGCKFMILQLSPTNNLTSSFNISLLSTNDNSKCVMHWKVSLVNVASTGIGPFTYPPYSSQALSTNNTLYQLVITQLDDVIWFYIAYSSTTGSVENYNIYFEDVSFARNLSYTTSNSLTSISSSLPVVYKTGNLSSDKSYVLSAVTGLTSATTIILPATYYEVALASPLVVNTSTSDWVSTSSGAQMQYTGYISRSFEINYIISCVNDSNTYTYEMYQNSTEHAETRQSVSATRYLCLTIQAVLFVVPNDIIKLYVTSTGTGVTSTIKNLSFKAVSL